MRRALPILALIQAISCAAAQPSSRSKATPTPSERAAPSRADDAGAFPSPPARPVFELPKGTVGPYMGVGTLGRMAAWAEPSAAGFSWYAASLRPGADPMPLGTSPERPEVVTVRRAGDSRSDAGYVVVASLSSERAVVVFALEENGRLLTKPIKLPTRGERVLWTEAVPHASGTTILWASTDGDGAIIEGVEAHPGGVLDRVPTVVALHALAWQAAPMPEGAALALVKDSGSGLRSVEVTAIDAVGEVSKKPWVIREARGVDADVDLVSAEGQLFLAWTERSNQGARILRARIDTKTASVAAARPLASSEHDQALVRLVPPASGRTNGYVVWEERARSREPHRQLTVARFDANGDVTGERATLTYLGKGTPQLEFSASPRGVGFLTKAAFCDANGECSEDVEPTFVEFNEQLEVIAHEPITLGGAARPADLAWGLDCTGGSGCRALATLGGEKAVVFDVSLGTRIANAPAAPREPATSAEPPPSTLRALVRADSIADFDVVGFGGSRLVAWVTDQDSTQPMQSPAGPAPDGKWEPVRALLDVVNVAGGEAAGPPFRVSWRARSVSGIDLAASSDRALLVWSALDNGKPEVFLTLLDPSGQRLKQRMFTHQRAEVHDVAATRVEGGWVVAWVDARNSDPEVYAARVTDALDLVTPGHRITQVKGTASDLELMSLGSSVLAVWSDDRADPDGGSANLHAAYLRPGDARPERPEFSLYAGEEYDHSPALAKEGADVRVAWIEQRMTTPPQARICTGLLDDTGRFKVEPARSASIPAVPVGLTLECSDGAACVVSWVQGDAGGSSVFSAAVGSDGALGSPRPVAKVPNYSARADALAAESGQLFLGTRDESGESINELEVPRQAN